MEWEWEVVHRELVGVVARRAALDAEEARLIRRALVIQVWREFGMVNVLDYLERVVGYAPRTAVDRVRVAKELEDLPMIETALNIGKISYSVAREIVRVAARETQAAWLDAVVDCTVREVEELVVGRRKGDHPSDPRPHVVENHRISIEVTPEIYARWCEARTRVRGDAGRRLEDAEVFAALCERALERGDGVCDKAPNARHQIAMTVCERCNDAWQNGGGTEVAVAPEVLEMAQCDAFLVGSLDGGGPERGRHTIPPAVRRFVFQRDGYRCAVPGCRSKFGLDIHHMIHQAHGGNADPEYLIVACHACHFAHHEGRIHISGSARDLRVDRPALARFSAHAGNPELEALPAQARSALTTAGYPPTIARAAVADAVEAGADTLETMIRIAFQRAAPPRRPTHASRCG